MDFKKDKLIPVDFLIIFGIAQHGKKDTGVLDLAKKIKITPQYLIRRANHLVSKGYLTKHILKKKGLQGKKVILSIPEQAQDYIIQQMRQSRDYDVEKTAEDEGEIKFKK